MPIKQTEFVKNLQKQYPGGRWMRVYYAMRSSEKYKQQIAEAEPGWHQESKRHSIAARKGAKKRRR